MYVFLHQQYRPKVSKPLTIQNRNPAFFIESVQDHAEFLSNDTSDEWLLSFFKGSAFPQTISVKLCDSDADKAQLKPIAQAAWFNNKGDGARNRDFEDDASQFARNSGSLDIEQASCLTEGRFLLTDRSTCIYFAFDEAQFQRIVICLALAVAYAQVVRDALKAMTSHIKNNQGEHILALYDDMLKFNAADYFALPVLIDRHELLAAWDLIYQHFRLKSLNEELTEQLTRVADLLRSNAERTQRATEASQLARDQRQNKIVTQLGIFIAAVSLLQLVQLTPKHFGDAWAGWVAPVWTALAGKDEQ